MKKPVISIILILAILVGSFGLVSVSASKTDRLLGDTDNDDEVTSIDVTLIQRHLVNLITLGADSVSATDIDGSGELEITDATFIQRWLADMTVPYAISEPINDYRIEKKAAIDALKDRLDQSREAFYVYKDAGSAENHFPLRTKMANSYGAADYVEMEEYWSENPHSGAHCIRCEGPSYTGSWVIWRFMNGYMTADGKGPYLNEGTEPGQGFDLTGADELRFFARGEKGGEKIKFSIAGYGRYGPDGMYTQVDYPDSCGDIGAIVTLSDQWEEYVIPLNDKEHDLSCIANGFSFTLYDTLNDGEDNIAFYLDDIRYTGEHMARLTDAPFLIRSYDTDKKELTNTAYSYDNALAAMAFLSAGEKEYAEEILDAFVYAVNHDRYQNGRIRNSYIAGDISGFPGWNSGVRFATFWGNGGWAEDAYQVGCNVGNTSYVALAMMQYDRVCGTNKYTDTAETLMNWVLDECTDGGLGFTAGYDGWPEKNDIKKHTYKSLEHSIDASAAFKQLYAVTGNEKYKNAADSALAFIRSMYNADTGWFYTGTTTDGVTPNTDVVVLDVQVWSAMAMEELYEPYASALDLVDSMKTEEGAYPFCQENKNGGFWCEGSAFTALMFRERGENDKFAETMNALCDVQLDSGLFPAATVDGLSTGIYLSDGSPWEYYKDPHITPTAWFIMAVNGFDPYRFE